MLHFHREVTLHELYHFPTALNTLVEEVKSIINCFDPQGLILHVVLQHQLLQMQECLLMLHTLPHLDIHQPRMRSKFLTTIITLLIFLPKLHNVRLLQRCLVHYLLLHSYADLQGFCTWLSENHLGVYQL
jgi:hypothetical protein